MGCRWGVGGGGAGEGCAGAGESSLTDSVDGTEVWGGGGAELGMNTNTFFPVPPLLAHKQSNVPLLYLRVCVCVCFAFLVQVWPPASKVYSCGATEDRKLT